MATLTQLAWLQTMVAPAQRSMARWHVPASVTLAQAILESAWGTSQLSRNYNNFFGIKAVQGESYGEFVTREVVTGRNVAELAHFARYTSAADSFDAHARLLATMPRYARAMRSADDPVSFAAFLGVCGYSTDPHYGLSVYELIREFNLTQYDTPPGPPAAAMTAA